MHEAGNDSEFGRYLNDLGLKINHSKKDSLSLEDIYIYPDIKDINDISTIKKKYYSVEEILDKYDYIYFLGTEEIGKTALLKTIGKGYIDRGQEIVILNGKDLKSTSIEDLLKKFYKNFSVSKINNLKESVLLIDDFSKQNLQNQSFDTLLSKLTEEFRKVIIFIDKHKFIQESGKYLKHNFQDVEILPFGYHKRHEFIKKWLTIGNINREENISNELYNQIDNIANHFNTIMKKNIMDSRPIYLITIIQTLENLSQNTNFNLTSFGQCYQILINEMLRKARITNPQDIDGTLNFLSYLSFHFYEQSISNISEDEFENIIQKYDEHFVAISDIKNILISSGILATPDNYTIQFSQKYLYYFCCAKHFSDNFIDLKLEISELCANIYNEEKANILIFLVHHLRGTDLLEEILVHTVCLLDNQEPFNMSLDEIKRFKKIISNKIKTYVLESKDAEEERAKILKKQDSMTHELDVIDLAIDENIQDLANEELDAITEFKSFQDSLSAVRSLEVLGQIAKNRNSSIQKDKLKDILEVSYKSGLKVLNFYLEAFNENAEELKNLAKEMILKNNNAITENEALLESEKFIHSLCFSLCFYMIQMIAKCTAHNRLLELSSTLANQNNNPANQLINLYSHLLVSYQLPKTLIKKIHLDNEQNPLVLSLLNGIVINHVYLHHIDIRDMQWLNAQLNIPMDSYNKKPQSQNMKLIESIL